MPVVYRNAYLWVNGVDLSGSLESLTLNYDAASLDATPMGSFSLQKQGGLKNQTVDARFFQKFTCVDVTMFGLVGCQTCVEVRSCNACVGATNPRYAGTFLVQSYPPMGGKVGEVLYATVKFEPAGDLSQSLTCP